MWMWVDGFLGVGDRRAKRKADSIHPPSSQIPPTARDSGQDIPERSPGESWGHGGGKMQRLEGQKKGSRLLGFWAVLGMHTGKPTHSVPVPLSIPLPQWVLTRKAEGEDSSPHLTDEESEDGKIPRQAVRTPEFQSSFGFSSGQP